jgi:pimeloyl-ACP methyl ester carboxylesterase
VRNVRARILARQNLAAKPNNPLQPTAYSVRCASASSKGVTLQTNADDVAGVVKALRLGPVHMVGNDFGNRAARMFAASYLELTRSVVLLAVGGKIPPKPAAERALMIIFNPKSTDKALGITIPPSLLLLEDEVIQ